MNNKRQKKIIIFTAIIFIIFIYISIFFIHNIVDIGNLTDKNPGNNVQGAEDENPDNNQNGEVVDNKDRIRILQNGTTNWNEQKELDIFKNSYFNDETIIAPGVEGSYSFTIENISETPCIYDVTYTEENIYDINMVYKLKKNGKYIVGNENTWVTYEKLSSQNTTLSTKNKDIYTIEWKWKDNDNDTEVGKTPAAYYKMFIKVVAVAKEGVQ